MRKQAYLFCLFIALVALLSSCELKDDLTGGVKVPEKNDSNKVPESQMGLLTLKLDPQKEVSIPKKGITKSAGDELDVNEFSVQILDEEGNVVRNYNSYAEIKELLLPAGTYQIVATKGELREAAYDAPYYKGVQTCVVNPKEVSDVVTPCVLDNKKITVNFSSDFLDKFESDFGIVMTNGLGVLTANMNDTRVPYFKTTENLDFVLHATTKKGLDISYSCDLFEDPTVKDFNNIQVDLDIVPDTIPDDPSNPNPGPDPDVKPDSIYKPMIKVDISLVEKEYTIKVPSNIVSGDDTPDDGGGTSSAAPTIKGITPADISKPFTVNDKSKVKVAITASAGLNSLIVNIDSPTLAPLLPAVGGSRFDMLNLTDIQKGLFADMTLPVKGQKTVTNFDITGFMPILSNIAGTHKFKIEVKDVNGKTASATLILVVE